MVQILHQLEKRNHCLPVARKIKKRSADAISPIAAQLTGSNTTTALGLMGRGNAPVIDLCCKLSDAGHDPRLPLHVHRGAMLALIVSSIGAAAGLEINGNGTGFRPDVSRTQPRRCVNGRVEVSARPTGWHQQTTNFAAAAAKRAARIAVTIGQKRRHPWPMSFSNTISTRLPKPISI